MEKEKILFESRGLPKKMKILLACYSIVWICMAALQMELLFHPSPKAAADVLNFIGFFYTAAVGAVCVAFSIGGSKLSMRVYENHIEGRASVSAKIKDVYITLDKVCAISSNLGWEISNLGWKLCYIEVQTLEGFEIIFYMDEKNIDQVSQILIDTIKAKPGRGANH